MELDYKYKTIEDRINSNIAKYYKLGNKGILNKKKEILEIYDFIIKMVYWYTIRYPKNELYDVFNDEDSNSIYWSRKLDYDFFLSTISSKYRDIIKDSYYPEVMQLFPLYGVTHHFHLYKDGVVEECEAYPELEGKNLLEVAKWAKDGGFVNYKDFIKTDESAKIRKEQRELLLESVMLKLIKDGGKYLGIRRALLFAKEFRLDLAGPMYYGISSDDEEKSKIVQFYIGNTPYYIDNSNKKV